MKNLPFLLSGLALWPSLLFAAEPVPWGLGLQPPASPVKERMIEFHDWLLMPIITGICVVVLILLIIVMVRYNAKANPVPSKTTHNVPLEVAWTVIPLLILVVISVPSFRLLYYTDKTPGEPEMTIKVSGFQWAWGYEYLDHEIERFNSYMIPDEEIDVSIGQRRLLSTDNVVVLPIETDIQILVTADDVLHSFAVPAFGIKKDSIPGRMNETWVRITEVGTYYGQCSELCGKGHAYMPIEIRAVEKDVFNKWAEIAKDDLEASYAFLNAPVGMTDSAAEPKNILEVEEN